MNYNIEIKPTDKNSWFTPTESNNYYKTKYARDGVTIHWWGGGESANKHDAIVEYFLIQGKNGVKSTNYVVSDNKITQMVDPDNVAWCSGPGNPTTISIEFQPTLSDEGYKRGGWLIKTLENKYGKKLKLYRHKDWMSTSCPGTIDLDRLRQEADGVKGTTPPATPAPSNPVTPVPSAGSQTVFLPASADTWAVYKVGSSYVKGSSDQVGTLLPSKFGGLSYTIMEHRGNVVVINTQSYGRVAIWVKDTEAVISSGAVSAQAVKSTGTVTFPSTVQSWAVYKVGSAYRKGSSDQVGSILPSQFGGLTYPIVENRGNVVVIDTQSYGRVAAWVQGTDAIIK